MFDLLDPHRQKGEIQERNQLSKDFFILFSSIFINKCHQNNRYCQFLFTAQSVLFVISKKGE